MKSFFWKFLICVVPVALAGWVTADAIMKYRSGSAGGFKFGSDLVGGTNLVYEIDFTKTLESEKKSEAFDASRNVSVLAEALKRRIDPNDLYNIVIRPAGEGRVEIILPTGGTYRTKKAQEAWNELLQVMQERWK